MTGSDIGQLLSGGDSAAWRHRFGHGMRRRPCSIAEGLPSHAKLFSPFSAKQK
uniref:Uncharacterized protein n=1 Tax=Arundo donax TaxID=35708 RepID=A0A0A9BEC4_ARUDO